MYTFTENLLVIYLFFLQGQRHGDGYRIPITHHLFLNLKNFTYNSINEDVEVFFSLYDARENKCIRLDSHTSLVKTRRQTRPICRIQIFRCLQHQVLAIGIFKVASVCCSSLYHQQRAHLYDGLYKSAQEQHRTFRTVALLCWENIKY